MNKRDRDNLNFILSLNEEQFDDWMESLEEDDLNYAIELIRTARTENLLKEMDLMEETNSDKFTQAKYIIDRIRNKSSM